MMPREQINTPARRTITTFLPDRPDPNNRGGTLKGNGLSEGEWALGWAQPGDMLHDGQHWESTPVLLVGWSKAGPDDLPGDSLQLVMDVNTEEVLRAAETIKHNRELYAQGQVAAPDPEYDMWSFSTVVISRPEAQKAIATVRRARNAVFGTDE
jgi:hypothetical protein